MPIQLPAFYRSTMRLPARLPKPLTCLLIKGLPDDV
jgi:hypothetical protein